MGKLAASIFAKIFKTKSISNDIVASITLLVLITSLFMTIYYLNNGLNVIKYIDDIKEGKRQVIADSIDMYLDQYLEEQGNKNENKRELLLGVNKLISNQMIASVRIRNIKTHQDVISTPIMYVPGLYRYASIYKDHEVLFYYYDDVNLNSVVNRTIKWSIFITLSTIFMGFLIAVTITRLMIRPIKRLIKGTEEFAKGNLSYKVESSNYTEIDTIVKAFNNMALNLNELYLSLEKQVQDRTGEVIAKSIELEKAYKELKDAQVAMVHNEKMKSLGELVAGITHEINNPINFIYGNMTHLNEYTASLIKLIKAYEEGKSQGEIDILKKEIEYDYILNDIPDLIKSCREGADRAKNIVFDLKRFSRFEKPVISTVDIHDEIELTLNILRNNYKYDITLHKDYGNIPKVKAYGGQLNQVFMNILDNAAYAIKKKGIKGDVYINTKKEDDNVIIEISDNGTGISKKDITKIFDPFFTTKPTGEGTGLGMSISYKIIKSHGGEINLESQEGEGTKFTIKIPIDCEMVETAQNSKEKAR